jgi:hypothetical protein
MSDNMPYYAKVTILDDRGNYTGLLIGENVDHTEALISVTRKDAPEWFRDAHKSPSPHVWVRIEQVKRD